MTVARRIRNAGTEVPTTPTTAITKGQRKGFCFDMVKMPSKADTIAPTARMHKSVNAQVPIWTLKLPVY